jgi:hypothetical protein
VSDERARLDPDGRYAAEGPLEVEARALKVLARLPGAQMERKRGQDE